MKEEILQKSLQLFLKFGIREMSNQKLVELLGISTKTVYKYFKNKEDLIEEMLDLFYTQHRQTWKNLSANPKAVTLFFDIWYTAIDLEYNVNKAFFQDLNYYYPELISKKETELGKEYSHQFIQVLYRGIEEGVFQQDINPEIVFTTVSMLFRLTVREEIFKNFEVSAYEILFNTIAPYIRGFCTNKGIKELNEHIKTLRESLKKNVPKKDVSLVLP